MSDTAPAAGTRRAPWPKDALRVTFGVIRALDAVATSHVAPALMLGVARELTYLSEIAPASRSSLYTRSA